MAKVKKKQLCLLVSAAVMLCGCVNIENRTLTESAASAPPQIANEAPVTVSVATTTAPESPAVSPVSATTEPPEEEIIEEYNVFTLTDEDNEFLSRCVFVGDSICSGLKVYGILPAKQVVAQGNIAARNIFDFTFVVDGGEQSLLSALVELKPEYVVFSMGMNDVNITSQEEYVQNYNDLLAMTESFLPNAKLIVLSITPIDRTSAFTANENIDSFNNALEKSFAEDEENKWLYVNVSDELKNSANALKSKYSSGDGIHLAPDAYYAILSQVSDAVREWENPDGEAASDDNGNDDFVVE